MIGILLNVVHFQVHKNITKESDGFHNHSTQLTMAVHLVELADFSIISRSERLYYELLAGATIVA